MQRMDFLFSETKATDDLGVVEGLASTYHNTDRHNERIMPGAFTKTLLENGNRFPLLWQHKADEPIGLASVFSQSNSLSVRAQLDIDVEAGRRAFSAAKKGIVRAFSIGFDTIKSVRAKDGVRELLEIRLWEVSLVTFPANPEAVVTGAKAQHDVAVLLGLRELLRDTRKLARQETGTDLIKRDKQLMAAARAFGQSARRFAAGGH